MKILMHYGQINQTILGCTVHHSGLGPLMERLTATYGVCLRTATAATTTTTIATITGFAQL